MLFILTSSQVLSTPFAGRNHVFDAKTTFSIFFSQENAEKYVIKRGLPADRCYSQKLVDTQKLVDSWGKYCAFLSFFPLVMEKDKKLVLKKKQMISLIFPKTINSDVFNKLSVKRC